MKLESSRKQESGNNANRARERSQEEGNNRQQLQERDRAREMRDNFRQMQMAIAMQEIEQRVAERSMLMQVMAGGGGMMSAQAEEERLLQRAIEESKQDNNDPNSPDVDNMNYE